MGFFSFLCKLDFNACLPPEDSAFTDPPGLCDEVKCAIETGSGLVAGSCGKLRGACESFKKCINDKSKKSVDFKVVVILKSSKSCSLIRNTSRKKLKLTRKTKYM